MHNMSDVQLPNVKKYEVDYLLLGVTFESEALLSWFYWVVLMLPNTVL